MPDWVLHPPTWLIWVLIGQFVALRIVRAVQAIRRRRMAIPLEQVVMGMFPDRPVVVHRWDTTECTWWLMRFELGRKAWLAVRAQRGGSATAVQTVIAPTRTEAEEVLEQQMGLKQHRLMN